MNDARTAVEFIASLAASYEKIMESNRTLSEYSFSELKDAMCRLAKTIAPLPPKE